MKKYQMGGATGAMPPPPPAGGMRPPPVMPPLPTGGPAVGVSQPVPGRPMTGPTTKPVPGVISGSGKPPVQPPKLMDDSAAYSGRPVAPSKRPLPPKPTNPNIQPRGRMAKGGSASSRADGIAKRGKTKGKMI